MSVFFAVVMFPLSTFESVNSLRFTSLLGVLRCVLFLFSFDPLRRVRLRRKARKPTNFTPTRSIVYLCFATAWHSVRTLSDEGWSGSWGETPLFTDDPIKLMQSVPVVLFAYTCQVNVFSIYDELERKSGSRFVSLLPSLSLL